MDTAKISGQLSRNNQICLGGCLRSDNKIFEIKNIYNVTQNMAEIINTHV